MPGYGNLIGSGVQGYRQAVHDNGLREDRDYQRQQRIDNDQRRQVMRGREDQQWDAQQEDAKRLNALRQTVGAYSDATRTGDSTNLLNVVQQYDSPTGAKPTGIQILPEGATKWTFDDGNQQVFNKGQFIELLKQKFKPETWIQEQTEKNNLGMKFDQDKEMLGLRTDKTKEINAANAENQKGVATHASGLKAPTAIKYTDENGLQYTRLYTDSKNYEEVGGAQDPAITKANKKGGKGRDQLDMDKFFAQLAAKQFGSPDANGNIMLDEKGGIQKSKVETLASTMYREHGDKLTPLQYFSRALKITRDNPALTKAQAMKKLEETGDISKPGWFASKAEEKKYEAEVQKLINESESPNGITESNGVPVNNNVNPPSSNQNSQTGNIPRGDPLGIR